MKNIILLFFIISISKVLAQTTYLDERLSEIAGIDVINLSERKKNVICLCATDIECDTYNRDKPFTLLEERVLKYSNIDYNELLANGVDEQIIRELFVVIWNGQLADFVPKYIGDNDGFLSQAGILVFAIWEGLAERFIGRISDDYLVPYKYVNVNTVLSNGINSFDLFSSYSEYHKYNESSWGLFVIESLKALGAKTSPKRGIFKDPRDRQTYETITIDSRFKNQPITWMVKNLNYKSPNSTKIPIGSEFGDQHGVFYSWEEAKIICPNGWHLPSESEWDVLIYEMGTSKYGGPVFKGDQGWNDDGAGLNDYGFNAFPAGYKTTSEITGVGDFAYFWTSSASQTDKVLSISVSSKSDKISKNEVNKDFALSCRCVKD